MNVWAVGRNYADHAKEMGCASTIPADDEPLIFLKAGSCVVPPGRAVRLPKWSSEVHHEVELAFRFGSDLQFDAFAIALDLTARDVQAAAKKNGKPWTMAKSFTDSCPLGTAHVLGRDIDPASFEFSLAINGEVRQRGRAHDMIFPIEAVRYFVTERLPVQMGDWLLTGTPAGVAALRSGDHIMAEIKGHAREEWLCD